MSYKILTDSASNLTPQDAEQYKIEVVPFTFSMGGRDFKCYAPGVDQADELARFYELMRVKADVKTSMVNADRMLNAIESIFLSGEDVLFIGISGQISGTMQAARAAAEEAMERYPERNCVIVDSLSASLGEGLLAIRASEMQQQGFTIYETATAIEALKMKLCQQFTVDDLYFLKRSGRVSSLSAFAGSMMGIKPMLYGSDAGRIELSGKIRGRAKAMAALADSLAAHCQSKDDLIGITHGDCEEDALLLRDMIMSRTGAEHFMIRCFDLCTGAHAGPGALAVFYISKTGRRVLP
ncbi:MAG: DegV family protein [Clostridiales bacterium]|nr:DegV family protein [Clostridiales bacterium]